jgi:hypothetical protein
MSIFGIQIRIPRESQEVFSSLSPEEKETTLLFAPPENFQLKLFSGVVFRI